MYVKLKYELYLHFVPCVYNNVSLILINMAVNITNIKSKFRLKKSATPSLT